jgi:hypothetical protein
MCKFLVGMNITFVVLVVITIVLIPYAAEVLRMAFLGIYERRIVGGGFVSEWAQIEKVTPLDDRLRLIDKTRGAFDFVIEPESMERVKKRVLEKVGITSKDSTSIELNRAL